ncbi:MAG: hypothetical protein ACT4PT_02135, partial [Methanobacteriota archaeon]
GTPKTGFELARLDFATGAVRNTTVVPADGSHACEVVPDVVYCFEDAIGASDAGAPVSYVLAPLGVAAGTPSSLVETTTPLAGAFVRAEVLSSDETVIARADPSTEPLGTYIGGGGAYTFRWDGGSAPAGRYALRLVANDASCTAAVAAERGAGARCLNRTIEVPFRLLRDPPAGTLEAGLYHADGDDLWVNDLLYESPENVLEAHRGSFPVRFRIPGDRAEIQNVTIRYLDAFNGTILDAADDLARPICPASGCLSNWTALPPVPVGAYASVALREPSNAAGSRILEEAVKTPSAGAIVWNLSIEHAGPAGTATLSWPQAAIQSALNASFDLNLTVGDVTVRMKNASLVPVSVPDGTAATQEVRATIRLEARAALPEPTLLVPITYAGPGGVTDAARIGATPNQTNRTALPKPDPVVEVDFKPVDHVEGHAEAETQGRTYYFVTEVTDRSGRSEPIATKIAACYDAGTGAFRRQCLLPHNDTDSSGCNPTIGRLRVDHMRPVITSVRVDPDPAGLRRAPAVSAIAADATPGAGLRFPVEATFHVDGVPPRTVALGSSGDSHSGGGWEIPPLGTSETNVTVSVAVFDRAGNSATSSDEAVFDTEPPRLGRETKVTYDRGSRAKPGTSVEVQAAVLDARPATATLDLAGLSESRTLSLTAVGSGLYRGSFVLSRSVPAGYYEHRIPIRLVDSVGNSVVDVVPILVTNQDPRFTRLAAFATSHRSAVVVVETDIPTSARVHFGSDEADLVSHT